ncbi:hypothetical protein ACQEVF_25460 [Nonomuraea polychroma]|uniref:hypothetical protein n=1 Tax=Nonomuraea polychroma TaxID=46176 RepID=UPI003D8B2507
MFKRFSRRIRREHQPAGPVTAEPVTAEPPSQGDVDLAPPSPPGRFWAIGVLVLAAVVSMSMNTWHAWTATALPKPLAILYGVAPVALAAMQSHAVALRALRKEKVGTFRRTLTFGLVLGGLGLSFLGIYDLLRHAVPDPIPGVPLHEPAVFFSIVIDLMALAALHELLRESPAFVTAARATETAAAVVPDRVPEPVPAAATTEDQEDAETLPGHHSGPDDERPAAPAAPAVPDPFTAVPPQVNGTPLTPIPAPSEGDDEPPISGQVQAGTATDRDAAYYPLALSHFLSDVLQGEPPTVRTIKDRMDVGTDRARRLQAYLGQLVEAAR